MISQNVQMMDYMASMPQDIAVPRQREREESSSRSLFHNVILGIIMILMPFLASTILNGVNVQKGLKGSGRSIPEYHMQQVRAEVMNLEKENSVLKLEVSRLNAPVRIQKLAETKLGMRLPVRNVYGGVEAQKAGAAAKTVSAPAKKAVR